MVKAVLFHGAIMLQPFIFKSKCSLLSEILQTRTVSKHHRDTKYMWFLSLEIKVQ